MIRNEIKELMTEFHSIDEDQISAKFAFPPSFTGFSGHFPGNPLLPGVCQIQCILVALSQKFDRELSLKSVSRAKYLNTVSPEDEITVEGTATNEALKISAKFTITKQSSEGQVNVSRISLVCG